MRIWRWLISFSVINESFLLLIRTLPEDFEFVEAQSDSDDDDFGDERNDDDLRVSWLLNLDDLSLKRLEVEGEGPLYGVPEIWVQVSSFVSRGTPRRCREVHQMEFLSWILITNCFNCYCSKFSN